MTINLRIPVEAALEMGRSTPRQALEGLLDTGKIKMITVATFCVIYTLIVDDATGNLAGVVGNWHDGTLTVCKIDPDDHQGYVLIGVAFSEEVFQTENAIVPWNIFYHEIDQL